MRNEKWCPSPPAFGAPGVHGDLDAPRNLAIAWWSMAVLSDMDFRPGREFQETVYDLCGPLAHLSSPSSSG